MEKQNMCLFLALWTVWLRTRISKTSNVGFVILLCIIEYKWQWWHLNIKKPNLLSESKKNVKKEHKLLCTLYDCTVNRVETPWPFLR
jgi:hypothetical protein